MSLTAGWPGPDPHQPVLPIEEDVRSGSPPWGARVRPSGPPPTRPTRRRPAGPDGPLVGGPESRANGGAEPGDDGGEARHLARSIDHRLSILTELSDRLVPGTTTAPAALALLAEATVGHLGADLALACRLDPGAPDFELLAAVARGAGGGVPLAVARLRVPIAVGSLGRMLDTRCQAAILEETAGRTAVRPVARAGPDRRAILRFSFGGDDPLSWLLDATGVADDHRRGGRRLLVSVLRSGPDAAGLLILARRAGAPTFTRSDALLTAQLSDRTASAVYAAAITEQLETRVAQQVAVADLSQRALSGVAIDDLLGQVVDRVAATLRVDLVGILELGDDPATLVLRAGVGWPAESAHDGRRVPLGPDGQAVYTLSRAGAAVISADLGSERRFATSPLLSAAGVVSSVNVAIGGDRPIGLIGAHSRTPRVFSKEDCAFMVAAANVVVAARERHDAEAAMRHQAHHDPLTGLPNRRVLLERLSADLRRGRPLTLVMLDLDRFKEVNDSLGHHLGDLLLTAVGRRLEDLGDDDVLVTRLGGDEFALLRSGPEPLGSSCPSCSAAATPDNVEGGPCRELRRCALAFGTRVLDVLRRPFPIGGVELAVDASVGIAVAPLHGRTTLELLQRGDIAMYRAKRVGSGVSLYEPAGDDPDIERLTLAAELRGAADRGELRCAFQPKVALGDGRVVGAEALVRWDHPRRGLIGPSEFIGIAEHTGAIAPLSWWVLDESLRQLRGWRDLGLDLTVSVNCSARLLAEVDLCERVSSRLDDHGVEPARLVLEITESAVMADPGAALRTVRELHDLGTALSIDDFGTGHSSLVYLQQLPAAELKIDRRFVAAMHRRPNDAAIVRSVVELGHNLGMEVVAEGVETTEALGPLRACGCDVAQGYALGRPMAADQVAVVATVGIPLNCPG